MYGMPKIHKANHPLRPIVSNCGSITYRAAKYLAGVLNPLVGKNGYSVANLKELAVKLKDLEIPPPQKLVSYDVTALFTSVPADRALAQRETEIRHRPILAHRGQHQPDYRTVGVVLEHHLLPILWVFLPANSWHSYGFANLPDSG